MTDPPLITDDGSAAAMTLPDRERLRLPLHSERELATCSQPEGCVWKAERSRFRTP